MAQAPTDSSTVETADPEESSPNMIVYRKIEDIITRMQDDKTGGVPIRTVKSFLSKIPSVVTGADIVQWLMKNLSIEDPGEAIHLGSLIAAQGYVFPISDHVLTLKDDGTFYRFQAPYFWPSNCWEPENTDYAIYLCKRTMQNKARLELADYEAENLARLQRAFARKWEFIFMQAEAQVKIDRKKDKTERKILDSQERAFWDVHRPVPGCVNTTEMDIRKCRRMKNPQKVKKSVYGVTEESQPQSPVHMPSQPVRKTTKEDFRKQITFLNVQIERHCLKMSKVAESLIAYTEQYVEYDPFITPAEPSNPWINDDTALWDIEMSKEPNQQRVKRWGFSMDEVLKDPVGRDQFLRFLESEFSSENLRFWLAVQDLKKQPLQDVPTRVEEIWQEFLAPGAQSAINLDSHSYEKTSQNVKDPGRYTYEDAQEHIYKLMKSDSYARFLRSNAYQDLLLAKKKKGMSVFVFFTGGTGYGIHMHGLNVCFEENMVAQGDHHPTVPQTSSTSSRNGGWMSSSKPPVRTSGVTKLLTQASRWEPPISCLADVNQNQKSQLKQPEKENSMNKKSIPIAVRHSNAQTLFEPFKKLTGEKPENEQGRRTSLEKFTRSVGKSLASKRLTGLMQSS